MANSVGFHESEKRLSPRTRDLHRALTSLQEELEAIDWYQQRMDAAHDDELRDILRHARDEEIDHATMMLEWIRRKSPEFDTTLRGRLFAPGSIVEHEEAVGPGSAGGAGNGAEPRRPGHAPHVTVGALREGR